MAPTSTTPFTRTARLHRLLLQDAPLMYASETSKEMICSLREWLDNEIIFLLEVEAWKMKSPGGSHEGSALVILQKP
jgi:hypothetical protein